VAEIAKMVYNKTMADALTQLHQLFQEIPDLEGMCVDKTLQEMQKGFVVPVRKLLKSGDCNLPVKWFSQLALAEEIYLNHSRSMSPFRGHAWLKMVFLDDQFKVELLDQGQVVQEETLLVSSETHGKVLAGHLDQEVRFTLVVPGKFREVRKHKEMLDNLPTYLESLKRELVSALEMKHNLTVIKQWMRVLGLMSPKENPFFKDRPEVKTFLESRPLTLIPVKDCLHLSYVIESLGNSREVTDQIFFEKPQQIQYRKLLKLTLGME
jgi:hypothetical protein